MRKRKCIKLILGIVLLFFAMFAVFPFLFMFLTSLTQKQVLSFRFQFSEFSLKNYIMVFKNMQIGHYLMNSIIITGGAVLLNVSVSCLAGYAFAKKRFPGRDQIFFVYLATMMIPGQATLIPVFIIIKKLGLMNTYIGVMLPFVNAFGVFLVRQFMMSVPNELLEAAQIDGCREFDLFRKIVLPLVKPVVVTLSLFTFISCWSDFLWPLILSSNDEMQTLPLAVATLRSTYSTNYGLVMTGATLTFLPPFILYLFLQNEFVEGIALSGTKG